MEEYTGENFKISMTGTLIVVSVVFRSPLGALPLCNKIVNTKNASKLVPYKTFTYKISQIQIW